MVQNNRRVKHKSRKVVQKFNGCFELIAPLPQTAIDILGVLGAEGVHGEAAIVAKVVKSDVTYWKNKLVAAGALVPRKGVPKYYDLTSYGSKLLTGSDNAMRLPVVFEDYPVKFKVLQWERKRSDGSSVIDWKKLGQPRNWNKLGFRVAGVRVVKTSRSVIVHPGPLKGFDVDALEVDSGRIVERVRYILEVRFGMQLSDDCEFLHDPRWQVFRPEAKKWIEAGTVEVKGIGALDASPKASKGKIKDPLHKVAHLEFNNKHHAAVASVWPAVASDPAKCNASAAPMYPLYLEEIHRMVNGLVASVDELTVKVGSVSNLEGQISQLVGSVNRISLAFENLKHLPSIINSLEKVAGFLDPVCEASGNGTQNKSSRASEGGGKDYVS